MTATFLDENLPDGTRLRPGTKFIKYWKMRNTGTITWSADTKVKTSTVVICFFPMGSFKCLSSQEHEYVQQTSYTAVGAG